MAAATSSFPYTLNANDMRFATPQGFNTGEHLPVSQGPFSIASYEEGRIAEE
ncbi:hypothetical protein [Aestuariivirga sp.]|uniref:hypothetical protein n=1 Tax=Aestuariivirga sp. TaxID=2650926 RepID=UPI0039E51ED8